jgi:hypothetical protein
MALSGELDPDAAVIAGLIDRALAQTEVIKAQRQQIRGLVVCLKASHRAQVCLVDILDAILAAEFDD